MKHRVKITLRAMAAHIGLKVRFVDYFDHHTHGKLLVRERRILVNAQTPRVEHVFTILHEIGHFVVHHQNSTRDYCPGYLRKNWKLASVNYYIGLVRRRLRYIFQCSAGKEWEADLWAMCAFILIAKQLDCRPVLTEFLERHPEKWGVFILAKGAFAYTGAKTRLNNTRRMLHQLTA